MSIIIKRWADPFYMRYYLNLRLETLMPNIQIDVGQIKMRAQLILSPTPSKRAKLWAINFF